MSKLKTKTEYLTREKINQIVDNNKNARVLEWQYDEAKRKFSSLEIEIITDEICNLVQEWRKMILKFPIQK